MTDLSILDWAELAVAVATVLAAAFAGVQVVGLRRDQIAAERREFEAVSMMWTVVEAPIAADADGLARWVLRFTLANPGRMPIDDVRCVVHVGVPVRRVHFDGSSEEPTETLTFIQTIVSGTTTRTWDRKLVVPYEDRNFVSGMQVDVTFRDIRGEVRTNTWPRPSRPRPAGALAR